MDRETQKEDHCCSEYQQANIIFCCICFKSFVTLLFGKLKRFATKCIAISWGIWYFEQGSSQLLKRQLYNLKQIKAERFATRETKNVIEESEDLDEELLDDADEKTIERSQTKVSLRVKTGASSG